jgi:hypothetical protein
VKWARTWVALLVAASALVAPTGAAAETTPYAPDESEVTAPAPLAERPDCPVAPEPAAEGADASVLEQRAARIEADDICRATAARLGELLERSWWVVSEQLRAHAQGEHLLERLGTLDEVAIEQRAVAEDVRGEVPADLQVLHRDLGEEGTIAARLAALGGSEKESTEGVVETAKGVESAVEAGAESTRHALWYLIGVAAGAMVGYLFYRQVMPRA